MKQCLRHSSHHLEAQRRPRANRRLTTWTPRRPIRKKPRLPCQVCPTDYVMPTRLPLADPSSLAPSSYHNKRARLSGSSPSPTPTPSNAQHRHILFPHLHSSTRLARAPSSTRSAPPCSSGTGGGAGPLESASERERRRSVSQRSIPISALVTPHAPSIGRASSAYHMRDP